MGKEGAAGWEGQDCSGEGWRHPELPSLRGCTALLLPWELQWGWGRGGLTGLGNLPGRQWQSPGGLENMLSARARLCPPVMATLQLLRPAGMGKGVIYGLAAQRRFFARRCLILFGDDGAFFYLFFFLKNLSCTLEERTPGLKFDGAILAVRNTAVL